MPVYEYECASCGERLELRRGMSDSDSEIKCPRCGAEQPRRIFSLFATSSSSGACAPSSPT
ncbi:zinc ribbon domain-containing protein [Chloroflexota bacterium]